ncbi:MAG: TPM domain-containing protein [Myxococcales bacterium]|nr:TPM domain-containing protein [Myxococcales bacterium]
MLTLLGDVVPALAGWEPLFPDPPRGRTGVVDEAHLLDPSERAQVEALLAETDRAVAAPIVVATIPSLADYRAFGLSIEAYARRLYAAWGVGGPARAEAAPGNDPGNRGVLLLVSKKDRLARIELGDGWGNTKNHDCQKIMERHIVAPFRREEYARGVLAGVTALSAMVKNEPLPAPPRSATFYGVLAGLGALVLFTTVSLIRRGSSGWAWTFWSVVLTMLFSMSSFNRRRRYRGLSGGGFVRGGFSGGGRGATGRW